MINFQIRKQERQNPPEVLAAGAREAMLEKKIYYRELYKDAPEITIWMTPEPLGKRKDEEEKKHELL